LVALEVTGEEETGDRMAEMTYRSGVLQPAPHDQNFL
jgi:hypothetical protein